MKDRLSIISWLHLIAMVVLSISLPWAKSASTIPIIIWLVIGVFSLPFVQISRHNIQKVLPITIFFLFTCLFAFLHEFDHSAFIVLEKKSSLFYIPLLVMIAPSINKHQRALIEWSFVLSLIVFLLIAIISIYNAFPLEFTKHIFYGELLNKMEMHTSYISIFCLIASLIIVKRFKEHTFGKPFLILLLICFGIFIWLLLARTQILILILLLISFCIYYSIKRKFYMGLILVVLIPTLALNVIKNVPELKVRFEVFHPTKNTTKDDRYDIWEASKKLILQQPVSGYGIGSSTKLFKIEFAEAGKSKLLKKGINNAHNQYLHEWLESGILGLIFLILLLLYLLIKAKKQEKPEIQIALILIFVLSFFTECILESQPGVVSFAYFSSMMLRNER